MGVGKCGIVGDRLKSASRPQGASIVKSSGLLAVCGVGVEESCTVNVKVCGVPVPVAAAGVPVMVPVAEFRLRPSGRFGVTDQLRGGMPPELCKVVV